MTRDGRVPAALVYDAIISLYFTISFTLSVFISELNVLVLSRFPLVISRGYLSLLFLFLHHTENRTSSKHNSS